MTLTIYFNSADSDKDEKLSPDEFRSALKQLAAQFDKDGDGRISKNNWLGQNEFTDEFFRTVPYENHIGDNFSYKTPWFGGGDTPFMQHAWKTAGGMNLYRYAEDGSYEVFLTGMLSKDRIRKSGATFITGLN